MKAVREGCTRWADGTYTLSDDELDATLRGPMTMIVSFTGAVALVVDPVPHGVQARGVMATVSPSLLARIDSLAPS
jgi:hypothetical protein